MAKISQNTKYVKLDDGVSFALVRTNPKLTTNTKLMYNGKKMYMESYASSPLLNRNQYKNVSVKQNSTYNKDIARFLMGSGERAYGVYKNFSDVAISDSYDNQFENFYWCGAEYIDSSFYDEEIGFVAPLYLREKLPNYFLIFRLDTPSNYNLNVDESGNRLDSIFDFKSDILDKAVLIKTFDLREGSVLGNYIHNYIDQEEFEFDKSMYVNFSNGEVTYYGINKFNGVLEKKVENFENELIKKDNPVLKDDMWFTEGFERNNLIFPYIINIEYLFNDDKFGDTYDFARYIGVYCNNIEFGEFKDFDELKQYGDTQNDAIYYFEDNKKNLHRYSYNDSVLKIDGNLSEDTFDKSLISGFEKEKINGYAEPLDVYEGFINRAQYGFEIINPFEKGDWIGIKYDDNVECYFADSIEDGFNFKVDENSSVNDIAESLVKTINHNKHSKFEAKCSGSVVVIYAKREGKEYNESKILFEESLLYNKKIYLSIYNNAEYINGNDIPIESISDSDSVFPVDGEKSSFGNYYMDDFGGACNTEIDASTETYKNVFKIYSEENVSFAIGRYLKTNNGNGRKIVENMVYIDAEGKIDDNYRIVIVEDAPVGYNIGYDVSVSSTYQVEIMDIFKPNYGVLSWFPVKDFDFDINYSSYGQYDAFIDECKTLSGKITYVNGDDTATYEDIDVNRIKNIAKSPFFDDFGNSLKTEYDYYLEQVNQDLCLLSKTAPYISKWGYYDEQKDSCENPYRLNINKVFGSSNLSANISSRKCDETNYTHNMPYYMAFGDKDYSKNYQYILSDSIYTNHNNDNSFQTFSDCVNYWVDIFKNTDVDQFSYFFSGKKYGKRFDRKYSRLFGGDKFKNPSTLFRGVKFEAVRQYNGFEKRSSEYNGYKFSFVYIPVMIDTMVFNSTVHFVKNDTFKFIVGIVFVNTMLGKYGHNIFKGNIDYFGKGFLYAACKDIIRPNVPKAYSYKLKLNSESISESSINIDFWKNNYDVNKEKNEFYTWISEDDKKVVVTKTKDLKKSTINEDIIGEFDIVDDIKSDIANINIPNINYTFDSKTSEDGFKVTWYRYYENFDITIHGYTNFTYYGEIECEMDVPDMEFENILLKDVCDIELVDNKVDVSNLYFKSESFKNILVNIGNEYSINSIRFYDGLNVNKTFENEVIKVDINSGNVRIEGDTILNISSIENLKMDISIKDILDTNFNSKSLKDYFSVFNQLSMNSIYDSINSGYGVKYYSTVEDNIYKIRVVEPDNIKVKDIYEAIPVKITQNNSVILGGVEIKEKVDVDKIGVRYINRYSGFYNPIFNDILYYNDYVNEENYELSYSNTNIDYKYSDGYGNFGVIKNMYYHKTNTINSDKILSYENPIYPIINEYAIDYRDYNIFSSSWDEGYFISQDDINNISNCDGIGSMKESLCMFGSKYLNLPDEIFIDTFDNGRIWDETVSVNNRYDDNTEILYKEVNNRTVKYQLFIEKRLKRYLKDSLMEVFSKYINKDYSFGNKGTIEDDVDEYVEKNLLRLYKLDKVYMYIKSDRIGRNDKTIENEYLEYINKNNEEKIAGGFQTKIVNGKEVLKDSKFILSKISEFDRSVTYNLNTGFKESFGFGVSFKRK